MRVTKLFASAALLLSLLSAAARAEQFENPIYDAWAKCNPGTTVTLRGTSMRDGRERKTESVQTLEKVNDEHVIVDIVVTVNGKSYPAQSTKIEKFAEVPADSPSAGFKQRYDDAKIEDVTVPAGTFKVKVVETVLDNDSSKSKTWYCLDVPGAIVRIDVTHADKNSSNHSELVAINRK